MVMYYLITTQGGIMEPKPMIRVWSIESSGKEASLILKLEMRTGRVSSYHIMVLLIPMNLIF